MNWLDFIIIVVIVFFVLGAYSAGLIREVVTLFAVFFGIIIAGALYNSLAKDVLVFFHNQDAARAIAFLILFGSVYLIGQISAYILKTGAALLMLGWVDRAGGAVFGFLKGIIVVQVLLIVFAAFPSLDMDGAVNDSTLGPFFVDDVSFVLQVMPGDFNDRVDHFLSLRE